MTVDAVCAHDITGIVNYKSATIPLAPKPKCETPLTLLGTVCQFDQCRL